MLDFLYRNKLLLSYGPKYKKSVFSEIYRTNHWGDPESRSGAGSTISYTAALRDDLPKVLKEIKAKSLLDAPCGDFNWMKEARLDLKEYIGADIVSEIIAENQRKYGNENRRFLVLDITEDNLPQVDVIFCRDVFIHLSFSDVFRALAKFKESKSKYLIASTSPIIQENINVITGSMHNLNLELPPFNLPKPIRLIDDRQKGFIERWMGLWKIEDIKL